MTSAPVIDLERLLAPIGGDHPTGTDIRLDASPASLYYRIKDARASARAAERSDIEKAGANPEAWLEVIALANEILSAHAKDLEVAGWLIEALVRCHGFAGARDGFRLTAGLVAGFWDGIYPTPDEDGMLTRVATLTGLNGEGAEGTLIQPIRMIPLTQGSDAAFSLWQYDQALQLEKTAEADKKQWRLDQGAISLEAFTAGVRETPASFFIQLVDDIETAQAAFAEMTAALDAAAGTDAPPGANIRTVLDAARTAVRFFAADKLPSPAEVEAPDAPAAAASDGAAAPDDGARTARGSYSSREEAFRDIQRIATYFRRNEPHSFISYTLEEVVRRGRLPLFDLLRELIEDGAMRRQMMVSAGIKPPQEGPEESA